MAKNRLTLCFCLPLSKPLWQEVRHTRTGTSAAFVISLSWQIGCVLRFRLFRFSLQIVRSFSFWNPCTYISGSECASRSSHLAPLKNTCQWRLVSLCMFLSTQGTIWLPLRKKSAAEMMNNYENITSLMPPSPHIQVQFPHYFWIEWFPQLLLVSMTVFHCTAILTCHLSKQ